MNARWTINEEKQLINDLTQSKSYQELAPKYNRTPNALELRVKKIVYDNITNNRTPEMVGGHLNLPVDKVKQYYYSYKEMLEKRGKPVSNIDFNKIGGNNIGGNNIGGNNIGNNINLSNNNNNNEVNNISKKIISKDIQNGGNNIKDDRLNSIMQENETFKEIINNIKMRHKLRKLLKAGKLSPEMKDILKNILED